MSNQHLSQQQISKWIVGESTPEELQHGRECPECSAELAKFQEPVSTFRVAMQDLADREIVHRVPDFSIRLTRPRGLFQPLWRWAVVGVAVVMLIALPIYKKESGLMRPSEPQESALLLKEPGAHGLEAANEDALFMDAFATHLARLVPTPMEPVLALLPDETAAEPNGSDQQNLTIPGAIR